MVVFDVKKESKSIAVGAIVIVVALIYLNSPSNVNFFTLSTGEDVTVHNSQTITINKFRTDGYGNKEVSTEVLTYLTSTGELCQTTSYITSDAVKQNITLSQQFNFNSMWGTTKLSSLSSYKWQVLLQRQNKNISVIDGDTVNGNYIAEIKGKTTGKFDGDEQGMITISPVTFRLKEGLDGKLLINFFVTTKNVETKKQDAIREIPYGRWAGIGRLIAGYTILFMKDNQFIFTVSSEKTGVWSSNGTTITCKYSGVTGQTIFTVSGDTLNLHGGIGGNTLYPFAFSPQFGIWQLESGNTLEKTSLLSKDSIDVPNTQGQLAATGSFIGGGQITFTILTSNSGENGWSFVLMDENHNIKLEQEINDNSEKTIQYTVPNGVIAQWTAILTNKATMQQAQKTISMGTIQKTLPSPPSTTQTPATPKQTPGFEIISLVVAVGITAILLKRKRKL